MLDMKKLFEPIVELINSDNKHVSISDCYNELPISVWRTMESNRITGITLSKGHALKKMIEKGQATSVEIKINKDKYLIKSKHDYFKKKADIIQFLKSLNLEAELELGLKDCKSYPTDKNLFVNLNGVWLSLRADYSMNDTPSSTVRGDLSIRPSAPAEGSKKRKGFYKIFWQHEHGMLPEYNYNITLNDMEIVPESDIIAELL